MTSHCPITGVCIKRFWMAVIAGILFVWVYDWLLNAYVMMDLYNQTPQLWRSEADMQSKIWFFWVYHFLVVLMTAFIFTRNYENKGPSEGLRFGALIGVLFGAEMAVAYTYLPISEELAVAWFATGVVKGLGLGLVYALTYRDDKILAGKI